MTDKSPLTIQVKLNPKAVWQGGTPITSKDMVAFWKAQNGKDNDFEVSSTEGYEDISEVKTGDDPYSYDVVFSEPTAEWPLYIYPQLPANVSKSAKPFNTGFIKKAPSSNGPFMVTSIDAETGTVTEKPNPRWWGTQAQAQLDRLAHRSRLTLQAEAYAADGARRDQRRRDDLRVSAQARHDPAGSRHRVVAGDAQRRARTAQGRQRTSRRRPCASIATRSPMPSPATSASTGEPLGSLVYVPGQRGYTDSSAAHRFDRSEAKQLLAKAGYNAGADGVHGAQGQEAHADDAGADQTPRPTASGRGDQERPQEGRHPGRRSRPCRRRTSSPTSVVALDFDIVTFAWRGSAFPIADRQSRFNPIDSSQNFTGAG